MSTIRDAHFIPEWIDMGPQVPEPKIDWIKEKYLDLKYGDDPLQAIDLYLPNDRPAGPLPVLVLVHGGGFALCDKRDWHVYPGFFALGEGFALASVNYRLTPTVRVPAPVYDLKAALTWLRAHAEQYGLDKENFFLYGTSAGGNLVSVAALSDAAGKLAQPGAEPGKPAYNVRAVANLCGLVDFEGFWQVISTLPLPEEMKQMFAATARDYLGVMPDEDPAMAQTAGAAAYVTSKAPPFYIQHGTADPAVPLAQALALAQQLQAAGAEVELDIMEGVAHAGGGPEYLEPEHVLPILQFFKKHLK